MSKKLTDYTRREKLIGGLAVITGVFIVGGIASGVNNPSISTPPTQSVQQVQSVPTQTYKEVTETETIPFEKITKEDSTKIKGTTTITTTGVDGIRTNIYKLTIVDGVETTRALISSTITTQPISEVTSIGTYVAPAAPQKQASLECDPNYSGACVPIASDVDCGGGSGNGPAYLYGTATVIGSDIYGLDRDNDGVACE